MFLILLSFLGTLFKNVQSKPLKSGNVKVISTNVCSMQAYSATQLVLLPSMSQVSFTTFSLYISIILQIIHLYFHSLKRKKNLFWNASCFNLRFNTHTKLEIPGRFFTANDMTECIRLIMLKNCVRGPENSEWTRDVIFFL